MGQATKELERDAAVQQQLLAWLNKDEDWLFNQRLEQGAQYLELHYGAGTVREALRDSPRFWGWFQNQWAMLDAGLLPCLRPTDAGLRCQVPTRQTVFFKTLGEWRRYYLGAHQRHTEMLHLDSQVLGDILREARKTI